MQTDWLRIKGGVRAPHLEKINASGTVQVLIVGTYGGEEVS